jgi:hypothetical protein
MKLIDAVHKVDQSDNNSTTPDYTEFCEELGITDYSGWNSEFVEHVKGYYLVKWLCTDTWVGVVAWFMDGEPVAVSYQPARKSDTEYQFISDEAAKKVKDYILSIMEVEKSHHTILPLDTEIDDLYNVDYTNQLLVHEGFVDGLPCKVQRSNVRYHYPETKVTVEFEDGTIREVPISEFKIPIHIVKD